MRVHLMAAVEPYYLHSTANYWLYAYICWRWSVLLVRHSPVKRRKQNCWLFPPRQVLCRFSLSVGRLEPTQNGYHRTIFAYFYFTVIREAKNYITVYRRKNCETNHFRKNVLKCPQLNPMASAWLETPVSHVPTPAVPDRASSGPIPAITYSSLTGSLEQGHEQTTPFSILLTKRLYCKV